MYMHLYMYGGLAKRPPAVYCRVMRWDHGARCMDQLSDRLTVILCKRNTTPGPSPTPSLRSALWCVGTPTL
jgi:hypothetical protein